MRSLTAVERFFERLFERPSARLFKTRLQPVQLQRRIERAMETDRLSGADRTLVPNRFKVRLNAGELAEFGEFSATLAAELADGALAFARAHRFTLVDRPRVDLVADPTMSRGEVRVETRFADPEPSTPADGASTDSAEGGDGSEADRVSDTAIFSAPSIEAAHALIRELRPDGTQREVELDLGSLTIGRGRDNGLIIDDPRVSRHHARLLVRHGTLVFTDLGSTNGSRVNGTRVAEVVLGEGDRIELGDSVLVIESVARGHA